LLLSLLAVPVFASDLDPLVNGVLSTYGGASAWKKVHTITESGTVAAAMGSRNGPTVRTWKRGQKLRVEITYADKTEVRDLDGDHGTNNGTAVTGPQLDAMRLQWARLAIPALLLEKRGQLRDLGLKDGLHLIEIPLDDKLTVTASVDPKTFQIVRSTSKATMAGQTLEFVTEYSDLRKTPYGLLFAFVEQNFAQGTKTAETKLTDVKVAQ
jgi:hypothetical protein